jgi:proton-dependent oligopeptide transporter, POT family
MAPSAKTSHPPGLYVLFFTELWERYSFYSMSALLTLYMDEALGFTTAQSGQVYGLYTAGVYFLPLFGGLLADRALGFSRAILIGGVLMMCGHLVLGVERLPFFYTGLILLCAGSGLLKPNISTLVGNLYRDRPALRDAAFNIFYMGINIGGLLAPIGVSYLRTRYGWSIAFMSAAVAMAISLVIFTLFKGYVADASQRVDAASPEAQELSADDTRARLVTLLIIFCISAVFWMAWFQEFYIFSFWARDHTATAVPPERFQSIEPTTVVLLSPVAVWLWARLRARNQEPSTPTKMLMGVGILALAFSLLSYAGATGGDTGRASVAWIVAANILLAIGEISLSPMGMSLVNRLAPARYRGLMMGGWFVSLSVGGYLAGKIGGYWDQTTPSRMFGFFAAILIGAAIPLSFLVPRIKRTIERAEAQQR